MNKKVKILLADDDNAHRDMLVTLLQDWGFEIIEAKDGIETVNLALEGDKKKGLPDLVLADVRMPGKTGLQALEEIKSKDKQIPIIMMTAFSEVEAAVQAIRNGAYDYITKPLDFEKLKITLRNASVRLDLENENARLQAALKNYTSQLLGSSKPMLEIEDLIKTIAPTEATILIGGESGTGKELAAKAIHSASHRAQGPFLAINCGALTESLLTSELFGHEKGAFTGADKKRNGLFLEASGGTLFLDEIGEMPLGMQVKLLRVLQEREVLPLGGKKTVPIDCRIIAATNKDLAEEVTKGTFREDLYYRLNVVSLKMPGLKERSEDIPLLAINFAQKFAQKNRKQFRAITEPAMRLLQGYHWPGNVRELENTIERAIILMRGEYIDVNELPEKIAQNSKKLYLENYEQEEKILTLEEIEKKVILHTLARMDNNKSEAAKALGITRKTLHAKLNKYNEGK